MAATTKAITDSTTDIPPSDQPSTSENVRASAHPKVRKRTKTGCLTCRKRRIKCGEERPICQNCTKSKRNCEGYTPRVIWKDPQGALRLGDGPAQEHISHYHDHGQYRLTDHYVPALPTVAGQASFPPLRPRPPLQGYHYRISQASLFSPQNVELGPREWNYGGDQSHSSPSLQPCTAPDRSHAYDPPNDGGRFPAAAHTNAPTIAKEEKSSDRFEPLGNNDYYTNTNSVPALTGWAPNPTDSGSSPERHITYMQYERDQISARPACSPGPAVASQHLQMAHVSQRPSDYPYGSFPIDPQWFIASPPLDRPLPSLNKAQRTEIDTADRLTYDAFVETANDIAVPKYAFTPQTSSSGYWQQATPHDTLVSPHGNLQSLRPPISIIQDPEDDYFDVDSDEEIEFNQGQLAGKQQSDLGLMLALSGHLDERQIRSVTSFLNDPDILATYQPTFSASPLMDPQTARVFCHFVTSTAPSLSIYERRPKNPSVMFPEHPVPLSQQTIWTYTLPMMALSHRGLLHAMLALASFHIAKLQRSSTGPSLKHYQYALNRVAKAVGLPNKRPSIATLAASMLLGFYEVSAADHRKWNSHLAGARQLLMELDFIGMTKRVKAHKANTEARDRYHAGFLSRLQPSYMGFGNDFDDTLKSSEDRLDENVISIIVGEKVRSDQHGRIIDGTAEAESNHRPLTPKDIENYEIQRDLFWWYAKQDVYQSMVSGNRLLMPYYKLASCPPRASMGRIDAACGTMDHMILLMARIADFIGKDQPRKIKMMKANGGQWVPPSGMFPGSARGPPQQQPPTPQTGNSTNPQPFAAAFQGATQAAPPTPTFFGMMPTASEPVQLPPGFAQTRADYINPNKTPTNYIELDAATREAEIEWNDLRNAFRVFEEHLGPDYQPLSPEHMQPIATPFGPALCYRTYSISCIWALYYTGLIITARAHPCMPPAAMMAVGIAAQQTAEWANNIGRICAGLHPTTTVGPINPSLAAALSEITLTLFFAGVQYREAAQRGWTVTALRNVTRLTGWQSSSLIAAGCEVSWSKMAQAGRGPPYTATMEPSAMDDRVAGRRGELDNIPSGTRLISENAGTRVHWAMGIMSADEDLAKLSLSV